MVGRFVRELARLLDAHMTYELAQVADALDALPSSTTKFDHALTIGREHAETACIPSCIGDKPHVVIFAITASLRFGRSAVIFAITASLRFGRSADPICCCTMNTTSEDFVALKYYTC